VAGGNDMTCEGYRGCANKGHNGEECANWLSVNHWGDAQFIRKDEALMYGWSYRTNYSVELSALEYLHFYSISFAVQFDIGTN
jgi:hypothetical protein